MCGSAMTDFSARDVHDGVPSHGRRVLDVAANGALPEAVLDSACARCGRRPRDASRRRRPAIHCVPNRTPRIAKVSSHSSDSGEGADEGAWNEGHAGWSLTGWGDHSPLGCIVNEGRERRP